MPESPSGEDVVGGGKAGEPFPAAVRRSCFEHYNGKSQAGGAERRSQTFDRLRQQLAPVEGVDDGNNWGITSRVVETRG